MADNETPGPPPFGPELLQAALAAMLSSTPKMGPNLYLNGFTIGTSWSDIGLTMILNGEHVATVSMSFTTAKTLSLELSRTVRDFEGRTKHTILTMEEVRDRLEGENG